MNLMEFIPLNVSPATFLSLKVSTATQRFSSPFTASSPPLLSQPFTQRAHTQPNMYSNPFTNLILQSLKRLRNVEIVAILIANINRNQTAWKRQWPHRLDFNIHNFSYLFWMCVRVWWWCFLLPPYFLFWTIFLLIFFLVILCTYSETILIMWNRLQGRWQWRLLFVDELLLLLQLLFTFKQSHV